MAKKAYVGVSGTPKNVKAIYVGVNGVPKKVIKGYVGVNGVPCVFWDGGTPPTPAIIPSWDYWLTRADERPYSPYHTYKKVNNKICYYGAFIKSNILERDTLVISPDPDAVTMAHWRGTPVYTYTGTITDANNTTWYYTHIPDALSVPSGTSEYDISDEKYYNNVQQAAQDLLNRIYSTPFQSDYQSGQTYTLYATDQKKTLRKAYSTYLHRNINKYASSTEYRSLSDNANTIIDTLISTVQSYSASGSIIGVEVGEYEVRVCHGTTNWWGYDATQIDNASLESQSISNNYKLYEFSIPDPSYPEYPFYSVYPDWKTFAQIDSSGQITYDTWNGYDTQIEDIYFHAGIEPYYNRLTNIGIDL